MNIKRLVILARHLRKRAVDIEAEIAAGKTPRRGFYLGSWYCRKRPNGFLHVDHDGRTCGTTACAFGETPFIHEFRGLGLKRRKGHILYKGQEGEFAAAKFFDISEMDADILFMPNHYPSDQRGPLDVVRRIEELITRP